MSERENSNEWRSVAKERKYRNIVVLRSAMSPRLLYSDVSLLLLLSAASAAAVFLRFYLPHTHTQRKPSLSSSLGV